MPRADLLFCVCLPTLSYNFLLAICFVRAFFACVYIYFWLIVSPTIQIIDSHSKWWSWRYFKQHNEEKTNFHEKRAGIFLFTFSTTVWRWFLWFKKNSVYQTATSFAEINWLIMFFSFRFFNIFMNWFEARLQKSILASSRSLLFTMWIKC